MLKKIIFLLSLSMACNVVVANETNLNKCNNEDDDLKPNCQGSVANLTDTGEVDYYHTIHVEAKSIDDCDEIIKKWHGALVENGYCLGQVWSSFRFNY